MKRKRCQCQQLYLPGDWKLENKSFYTNGFFIFFIRSIDLNYQWNAVKWRVFIRMPGYLEGSWVSQNDENKHPVVEVVVPATEPPRGDTLLLGEVKGARRVKRWPDIPWIPSASPSWNVARLRRSLSVPALIFLKIVRAFQIISVSALASIPYLLSDTFNSLDFLSFHLSGFYAFYSFYSFDSF